MCGWLGWAVLGGGGSGQFSCLLTAGRHAAAPKRHSDVFLAARWTVWTELRLPGAPGQGSEAERTQSILELQTKVNKNICNQREGPSYLLGPYPIPYNPIVGALSLIMLSQLHYIYQTNLSADVI